jgi:hypothetical protein
LLRLLLVPLLVAIGVCSLGSAAFADTSILNIGPAFPAGPYTTLHVDRSNPQRVAVGTADGRVAWSEDSAKKVSEAQVRSARIYDAMAIRGAAKNSSLGSQSAAVKTQRPVRLFIATLGTGKGVVRWQHWRAISTPMTDIAQIALPHPGGKMMAATSAGILISDSKGGSWTRTLGAPGTMPREKVDLVGLSVVANPARPSFVLAGTTHGVFLSRDGGMNFSPHTDSQVTEEMIFEFVWDPADPDIVLAVGADSILQSEDGGEHFQVAFIAPAEINSVVTSDMGVFVATTDGLTLVTGEGNLPVISGESIVGVVPWTEDRALAVSNTKLYLIDQYGDRTILMRTTDTDPFMRLDGAPGLAYLLSYNGVFRIGDQEARKKDPRAPRMAMSMSAVQAAMLKNLGLGTPEDTRLHTRWYAKLLPRVVFDAAAVQHHTDSIMQDYTLPIDLRFARAQNEANAEFSVMAFWDLSHIVFGDDHASNPHLFIESTLRANRQRILGEVRTRYREAAMLTKQLQVPSTDPKTTLFWRMRLAEHTEYLRFVSGKEILKEPLQEIQP